MEEAMEEGGMDLDIMVILVYIQHCGDMEYIDPFYHPFFGNYVDSK
jgi:hypothetical protein